MKTTLLTILCFFICIISALSQINAPERVKSKLLETELDSLRVKYNIPAIAYGVIRNDSIIVQNAIGYRNIETKEKVQITDLFHIGSNTKSFTSFLAGKLVEDGRISWNTKFFDLYPEMKAGSNPAYFDITLEQLLSHRARFIQFKNESEVYPIVDYEKNLSANLTLPEKRVQFIKQVLKYKPIPVYDFHDDRYSNAGYIAAAIMLEKVTGKHWEDLISEVSEKLNLNLHIGWPDEPDRNQPQGHINPAKWVFDSDKTLIPIPDILKKYHYFNQYVLLCSPAGNTSINVAGFLRFLQLQIDGLNGKDNYLKAETYRHIIASYPDYSLGWAAELFGHTYYHHRGSAGTFNSIAIIVPGQNMGIVVMINTYDGEGMNEIAQLLIKKFDIEN